MEQKYLDEQRADSALDGAAVSTTDEPQGPNRKERRRAAKQERREEVRARQIRKGRKQVHYSGREMVYNAKVFAWARAQAMKKDGES